jgi:hypothetical protein
MQFLQSRTASFAALGISALAVAVALAPAAMAGAAPLAAGHVDSATGGSGHPGSRTTCYAQADNDNGIGVISQNFQKAFDAYDSRGADDFTLTGNCQVNEVDVMGSYISGSGPVRSANVTVYRDFRGLPGGVSTNQEQLPVTDDGSGNLQIPLRTAVGLVAGTYFLSVQVNLSFKGGAEWGWNTNNTQRGVPAVWRNKNNGFSTGCIHYTTMAQCIDAGQGADFAFSVLGK